MRGWWGPRDSNPEPIGYEPIALTIAPDPHAWRLYHHILAASSAFKAIDAACFLGLGRGMDELCNAANVHHSATAGPFQPPISKHGVYSAGILAKHPRRFRSAAHLAVHHEHCLSAFLNRHAITPLKEFDFTEMAVAGVFLAGLIVDKPAIHPSGQTDGRKAFNPAEHGVILLMR